MRDGVELTVKVYLTSSEGLDLVITMSGIGDVPEFGSAADHAIQTASVLPTTGEWRLMTAAEVADYKAREDAGDEGDDEEK